MAEFSSVARSTIIDNLKDIKERLDLDLGTDSNSNTYDDIISHNLYGIHIKNRNDALSDARPHICIGWSKLGDLSTITTIEELGDRHDQEWPDAKTRSKGQNVGQIWRFLKDVQIGDYVIFAEPDTCHIGKVVSDYYYDATEYPQQDADYKNYRNVVWLKKNIKRSDLSQAFHLSLRTAMSIWTLNDYKAAVAALLDGTYVKDQPLDIISQEGETEEKLRNCLEISLSARSRTRHQLNTIIYGAPGTGKTYSTAEYALAIILDKSLSEVKEAFSSRVALMEEYKAYVKTGQVVFTTFHQSYGYEDFIQGLRPDLKAGMMSFKTADGVFKSIADHALNNPDKDYVIIIDEINRANISKVFGELITLIENDKRWGEVNELSVTLQSGEPFAVPNNLYIIGTMNSADKSISLIDAALRRRFTFIEQRPDAELVENTLLKSFLIELNKILAKELDSTDLLVGHSYFMNRAESNLCEILNGNIIPLLYEYFYDNRKKVATVLNTVIEKTDAPIIIEDNVVGRLSVSMKGESNDSEQV